MKTSEIRSKYLEFFKKQGHAIIPSAPLVPENDPTTLFTGSGMQPMIPYLLGDNHPEGTRITDSQKAFRTGDIEEVGDNRHTTFFEMLGNWSLGDYFKKEQLPWIFEFITGELKIDPQRVYVTVFIGDEANGIPKDTESAAIWKELFASKGIEAREVEMGTEENAAKIGMNGERIFYYGAKNWWSRAGTPDKMPAGEPGGPDSEMFYEFPYVKHDPKFGEKCHPNCDCGRFVEMGNSVFMEYIKKPDGTFGQLPKRNVDYGGGMERIAMAANDTPDIIEVCHRSILDALEKLSGKTYGENAEDTVAFRIVADHAKAATFLIGDGVLPSNSERGYFVRRLLRRAVRYSDKLGINDAGLASLVEPILEDYKEAYPETFTKKEEIKSEIAKEEEKFRKTLEKGIKEIEKLISKNTDPNLSIYRYISGHDLFNLFSSFGMPAEVTLEEVESKGMKQGLQKIESGRREELLSEFMAKFKKHQDLSRSGSEKKFKGGLGDTSEATVKLHTAHHLLLKALQVVLGPQVKQRGSNITPERLRIDFINPAKVTPEQLAEAERIVNEKIAEDLPVIRSVLPKEEAEKLGAEHEFGAKYPDQVSVYSVGPKSATLENPQFASAYSIEFCGGPHVTNTGVLGHFKIQKEEAVSAGVRRIKAVLE